MAPCLNFYFYCYDRKEILLKLRNHVKGLPLEKPPAFREDEKNLEVLFLCVDQFMDVSEVIESLKAFSSEHKSLVIDVIEEHDEACTSGSYYIIQEGVCVDVKKEYADAAYFWWERSMLEGQVKRRSTDSKSAQRQESS